MGKKKNKKVKTVTKNGRTYQLIKAKDINPDDFRGSCAVCLSGTDTILGFEGCAEWVIAGLGVLGVPIDEAPATLSAFRGLPNGTVPDGVFTQMVQVCERCVSDCSAPFPRPVCDMVGAEIPVIRQPYEYDQSG